MIIGEKAESYTVDRSLHEGSEVPSHLAVVTVGGESVKVNESW